MKKILYFLSPLIIAVLVIFGINFYLSLQSQKGALQVTSVPKSNVYLDGKLIGQTPLCKCTEKEMILEGDYKLKIVSLEFPASFEEKIKISKSVLTVVDRSFSKSSPLSEGSVISLKPLTELKSTELSVLTIPKETDVFIDSNFSGKSPVLIKNLSESDHELRLVKNGYEDKIIRVRTAAGYELKVLAYMGLDEELLKREKISQATDSGSLSLKKIVILQTPTGFLRVRENSSLNSREIGRVNPGENFDFIEEKEDWIKIKLKDGKEGWISSQYARLL